MLEKEFRSRLRDALGEPPPLAAPKLGPSDVAVRRAYPRAMAALAIALAVVLVVVLVASRVALRQQGMHVPGGKDPTQVGPDSFPCSLAVVVITQASNRDQLPSINETMGFVNIPSGELRVDPAASVRDLPSYGTPSYSAKLKRWIPVPAWLISPDGSAYAYVRMLPEGAGYTGFTTSELHIYDLQKKSDRKIWTYEGSVNALDWDASGVVASTHPFEGGLGQLWRVDPASGGISAAPPDADPNHIPWSVLSMQPHGGSYGGVGVVGQGQAVFRVGSRDPGTKYSIVLVASGQATTLYSGTNGDSTNFDPMGVYSDDHGLWLGNFDNSRVWLWSESSGLRDFKVRGLPRAPAGYAYTNMILRPAGPCVPGVFKGVAAPVLPAAPTPTPSPPPPVIDWSTLTSTPLKLDQLQSGAPCPVSPKVEFRVRAQISKWPNYGYGAGPAYLSGQVIWYTAGLQGAVILTDPKYTGPVLVRSRRLDGTGSLTFSGESGTNLGDGQMGLAQTSSPPYWGTWAGTVTADAPGCYGVQFDGTSFSEVVVILVAKGPPPPG